MYIQQINQPLQQIARLWKQIRINWIDIEMVLELLSIDEQIPEV